MSTDLNDYAYGPCRDLGHDWNRNPTYSLADGGRTLLRTRHCRDCTATKIERSAVNARGRVVMRMNDRRSYPEGYLIKGGVPRGTFRVMALEAALRAGVPAGRRGLTMVANGSVSVRCNGITVTGRRCRRYSPWVLDPPSSEFYCPLHAVQAYDPESWTS